MSKKNIILLVVIIVIVFIGLFLWRGGFLGHRVGPTGEVTGLGVMGKIGDNVTGGAVSTGKITDDVYIELMAQVAYLAQKNPYTYAASIEALYKKYGITEENMTAYSKELENKPERSIEIAQKYAQRVAELQGTAQ